VSLAAKPRRQTGPRLEDVLGAVVRGRVKHLKLTLAQKRSLRDEDGQIAL
jgi:hypothetical protein